MLCVVLCGPKDLAPKGQERRLALPKQDRIMLPAGLDILGRPKGENRIAHGLQPWEDGPEREDSMHNQMRKGLSHCI